MPPKWKKFEQLVTFVQQELAPDAIVKHNDKIMGSITHSLRQVDVSVRKRVGQFDILIAIDCKDLASPADVKHIEETIGLFEDIKANKGAIVSARGFTKAAKIRGERAGLDLLRLLHSGPHEWKVLAELAVICDFRGAKKFRFQFQGTGFFELQEIVGPDLLVYDQKGVALGSVQELFTNSWNEGLLPCEPGEHNSIEFIREPTFTKNSNILTEIKISADMVVDQRLYFGQLSIEQIAGFQNEVDGSITARCRSDWLNVQQVEQNWRRLESVEDLAIQPFMQCVFNDFYPISSSETP
jgi:hypothetical protein